VIASANQAGAYLVEHSLPDGSFVYEYDPVRKRAAGSYNILRHAGTVYALLELYRQSKNPDVLRVAQSALAYLHAQIRPCLDVGDVECVVEDDEIKLGGNALAILAFVEYAAVTDDEKYLPAARRLSRFVTQTQSSTGQFLVHKLSFSSGRVADFESSYYPGEALFALAKLAQRDKDTALFRQVHRGAQWIIEVRDGNTPRTRLEHDHWLLYALNELHADRPEPLYVDHTRRLTDAISAAQHRDICDGRSDWNGGYFSPPHSTPAATRSEGLAAAWALFSRAGDTAYMERAKRTLNRGIRFQLETQMTKEKAQSINADKAAVGGFHESLTEYSIRIDYVQHNISSLLGYLRVN